MPNMSIKQALREADTVTKFLGDPWGFDEKITKREAKIIVENHGLDLSEIVDDDGMFGSDIWEWNNSIKFIRGSFGNRFEIWEHREDCIGSQENPDVCSCGIKAVLKAAK
tara:strand:- start:60 stop:389 length:330 start_codon:yes stop_codon:yes gene_type:complete